MVTHVVVHDEGVLEAELVAVVLDAEVLLDAFADYAGAAQEDLVLVEVGCGAACNYADLIVDDYI